MTEYITSAAGDRVAYDRRGTGPAVVFIAGAGPYRAVDPVTTQTAELAAGQSVSTLVFDRLGRGESAAAGRLDLDRELEAISALLDVAGGHAVLVGHSSGCSIALAAAARGLQVDGLALWEAPLGGTDGGAQAWSDEVERRIDADDLEGALEHYMKDMPPEWLAGAKASPQYQQMVAQVVTYRADGQSLAWAESAPLAQLLASVKIPVLAMYGKQTFPEMPRRRTAPRSRCRARSTPGSPVRWPPSSSSSPLPRGGTEFGHGAVRVGCYSARWRRRYWSKPMRLRPAPSSQESLARAIPSEVGRRLPSSRCPGVRR